MKKSEELFLKVLCCGLKKEKGAFSLNEYDGETLKAASHLAEINSLTALYYEGILYVTESPADKLRLTGAVAGIVGKTAEVYKKYRETVEALGRGGVELVTMKGYVVRNVYPVPEYRSFGDVDILIHRSDLKRAVEIMEGLGFKRELNEAHIAGMRCGANYFEVHTRLLCEDSFCPLGAQEFVADPWGHTVKTELAGVNEFTAEFHVLYLILHIAKHFYNMGAGVRMFLDLALIAEKYSEDRLNWALVREYLDKACLTEFAGSIFALCKSFFGTNAPEKLRLSEIQPISEETLSELCDYVLNGGTFGYKGPAYEVAVLRQAYFENAGRDTDNEVKKKTAFRAILPSRHTMEKRYPFCRKSVFLIPVAHLVRLWSVVVSGSRAKSAVRRMKSLCSSEEIARKQVDFYEKIGL